MSVDVPELQEFGPFTSRDIDFFGSGSIAQALARALNGEIRYPDFDDHTPHTALVTTAVGDYRISIDFLDNILGLGSRRVRASAITILLGPPDGESERYTMNVMHPVDCLISRINSMKNRAIARTDDFVKNQNKAAFYVLRQYISDMLDEDAFSEAKWCFQALFEFLSRDPIGRAAHIGTPIDPLGILETFALDERIDERYRAYNLSSMIDTIQKKRQAALRRLPKKNVPEPPQPT